MRRHATLADKAEGPAPPDADVNCLEVDDHGLGAGADEQGHRKARGCPSFGRAAMLRSPVRFG